MAALSRINSANRRLISALSVRHKAAAWHTLWAGLYWSHHRNLTKEIHMRKRRPSQLHSLLADLLLGLPPQLRQHYTRTVAPVQRQLAGWVHPRRPRPAKRRRS